jgi:hypothetical protein
MVGALGKRIERDAESNSDAVAGNIAFRSITRRIRPHGGVAYDTGVLLGQQ